jgi:hypothetical protein
MGAGGSDHHRPHHIQNRDFAVVADGHRVESLRQWHRAAGIIYTRCKISRINGK